MFGWILHGGSGANPVTVVAAKAHAHAIRASVHEELKDVCNLDHLGVTSDVMLEHDLELEVKNAIQRDKSDKYVVSWPGKPPARKNLALDKTLCETKLRQMARRITHEEHTAYDHQLKSLLKEGHIELLPRDCIPQ